MWTPGKRYELTVLPKGRKGESETLTATVIGPGETIGIGGRASRLHIRCQDGTQRFIEHDRILDSSELPD